MLDVAVLFLLERLATQGAGDVPEDEEVEHEAHLPAKRREEVIADVQVTKLGHESVQMRISLRGVMQRFFDGGVIMMRMLSRSAVMAHPLIKRLLNRRKQQRRG